MEKNYKRGLTIIEMIVSVGIILLIMGVLSGIITSYNRVYQEGRTSDIEISKGQRYQGAIVGDLKRLSVENGALDRTISIEYKEDSGEKIYKFIPVEGFDTDEKEVIYTYDKNLKTMEKDDVIIFKEDTDAKVLDLGIRLYERVGTDGKFEDLDIEDDLFTSDTTLEIKTVSDDDEKNYYFEPYITYEVGEEEKTGYTMRSYIETTVSGGSTGGGGGEWVTEVRPDPLPTEEEVANYGFDVTLNPLPSGSYIIVNMLYQTGHQVEKVVYKELGKEDIELEENIEDETTEKLAIFEGDVGVIMNTFHIDVTLKTSNKQEVDVLIEVYK